MTLLEGGGEAGGTALDTLVWLDEYILGARPSALHRFHYVILLYWAARPDQRGSEGNRRHLIMLQCAPERDSYVESATKASSLRVKISSHAAGASACPPVLANCEVRTTSGSTAATVLGCWAPFA